MRLDIRREKTITFALFAIYLLALAWLILFKLQFHPPVLEVGRTVNPIPLLGSFDEAGKFLLSDVINNILVFMPFGLYISMLSSKRHFAAKALFIAAFSLCFEALQFLFAIGRADITDLLNNTLGGLLGLGLYGLLSRSLKGRTNGVLNLLAAAFTLLALCLVTYLLATQRWIRIR